MSRRQQMSFKVSGLRQMREYFRSEIATQVEEAKQAVAQEFRDFGRDVADFNVPVGPSHRRDVAEGTLKASTETDVTIVGDTVRATISVGNRTDYVRYVDARDGVDFWQGDSEVIARVDALTGTRARQYEGRDIPKEFS